MDIIRSGAEENFSDFVIYNGVVALRGVTANDQSASIEQQTSDCLSQIDSFLAKAGTRKDRLLTATVYISDMANKNGMNASWKAWIAAGEKPIRATVQTPLATANTLVEIVVTAAV